MLKTRGRDPKFGARILKTIVLDEKLELRNQEYSNNIPKGSKIGIEKYSEEFQHLFS